MYASESTSTWVVEVQDDVVVQMHVVGKQITGAALERHADGRVFVRLTYPADADGDEGSGEKSELFDVTDMLGDILRREDEVRQE